MNFYKHFIGDYQRDTAHLSMLEHAAYRMLLDHYYATEQPLPMPAQCERICRASTDEERAAVRFVVSTFFPEGVNKRASKEINDFRAYTNAQAMRAHKRWHSERISDGNASHSHSHSHSHKNTKEESKPSAPDASRPRLDKIEFDFSKGQFLGITEDQEIAWQEAFPAVPIPPAIAQAAAWLSANPANRKSNYKRFLVNWFSRAQDRAARIPAQSTVRRLVV